MGRQTALASPAMLVRLAELLSPRAWALHELVHPSLHPAAPPIGASLAKLGALQDQLPLRWHLGSKHTE